MADCGSNTCSTSCGSSCCCHSNSSSSCNYSTITRPIDERCTRGLSGGCGGINENDQDNHHTSVALAALAPSSSLNSSLESSTRDIEMYHRPFSETPDIFKAHIPTSTSSSSSCYMSYHDSLHEKCYPGSHVSSCSSPRYDESIGSSCFTSGNLTMTSRPHAHRGNMCHNGSSIASCSLSTEQPLPPVSMDVASLSTNSPGSSISTKVATSSTTPLLYTCPLSPSGRMSNNASGIPLASTTTVTTVTNDCLSDCVSGKNSLYDITGRVGYHSIAGSGARCDLTSNHYSLLTPLSIFTDDTRNECNFNNNNNNNDNNNSSNILPSSLYPRASDTDESTLISSSSTTCSTTTLPSALAMDMRCISSFDHQQQQQQQRQEQQEKLYHSFTSTHEDVTWNRFQGSLNSSLGRKYLQKSPVIRSAQCSLETARATENASTCNSNSNSNNSSSGGNSNSNSTSGIVCTISSIGREAESEKSAKVTNSNKKCPNVRRWMCPSRQVFSVTNSLHSPGGHIISSDCSSYIDECNYHLTSNGKEHRDNDIDDTLCSPFNLSHSLVNRSADKIHGSRGSRSNQRCFILIVVLLFSLTIVLTSCGFIVNHLINRLKRHDTNESNAFVANQRKFWWTDAIFYEIFPASFRDTDSDGFGDLKGITSKLSYIKGLGVTGIRLNSIFTALDYPHQFDHVIDFYNVDPKIGTLDDFKSLVKASHEIGLTVVLDINLSVTSDQHPWAISWLANKSSEYSSFYVITSQNDKPLDVTSTTAIDREGKDLEETHLSFGGHLYLNWSHPGVRIKMLQMLQSWLDVGVDGFYLKNLHYIQVTSVTILSEILDDLLEMLSCDTSNTASSSSFSFSNAGDDDIDVKSKYYTKRQVMSSSSSPAAAAAVSASSSRLHPQQAQLRGKEDENIDENSKHGNNLKMINDDHSIDNKRRLGKRILIANRLSIESLTHRKRHEMESKFFKPIHSSFKVNASSSSNTFSSSGVTTSSFSSSSPASPLTNSHHPSGNLMSDRKNHFTPSASSSSSSSTSTLTSVEPAISLQSIDFFSYFHLIDVFLDIRMNETENIRDQVNEIFLSDLTRSHPWILWNIGSSSYSRLASRIGSEFVAAASFLLVALPGSISLFYGDEIALTNSYHPLSNKEFRGGQLAPMPWSTTSSHGNSSQSSLASTSTSTSTSTGFTVTWIPFVVNGVNVERSSEAIRRFQHLTTFRRYNFISHSVEKYGNYLFHYINDGEIVLERYFSKKSPPTSHLQFTHTPDNNVHMSSLLSSASASASAASSSSSSSPNTQEHSSSRLVLSSSSFKSTDSSLTRERRRRKRSKRSNRNSSLLIHSTGSHEITAPKREEEIFTETTVDKVYPFKVQITSSTDTPPVLVHVNMNRSRDNISIGREEEESSSSSSSSSSASPSGSNRYIRSPDTSLDNNQVLIRSRFVLFANLAKAQRVRDFRDKFHSGSIQVTSNPKRMRDFLYLRSLKLDPGEAIIAQVE